MDSIEDKYLVLPTHTRMSTRDAAQVSKYINKILTK